MGIRTWAHTLVSSSPTGGVKGRSNSKHLNISTASRAHLLLKSGKQLYPRLL